jgi:hypothetical protein
VFTLFGRLFVGAALTVSLLCGCANGAAPSIPSTSVDLGSLSRSQPDVLPFGKWMYLAQWYGEDLIIYKRVGLSLQYDETLKHGVSAPQGTVATPDGWWYVANGAGVLVYRSTRGGPIAHEPLNDPGQFAVNVDVTPSRRLAAVSNGSSSSSGAGSVSVYLNRQQNPTRTLTYGNDPLQGTGIAIDHQDNCFWAFNDPNTKNGSIVEFSGCQGSGTLVIPSIGNAQGIVFDQSDDLYYIDQSAGRIYGCNKTSNCKPFRHRFDLPVNLNFDHKDKLLWLADAGGYIYAVDPKTGKIVFTMQAGGPTNPPFGIAPAPGG